MFSRHNWLVFKPIWIYFYLCHNDCGSFTNCWAIFSIAGLFTNQLYSAELARSTTALVLVCVRGCEYDDVPLGGFTTPSSAG